MSKNIENINEGDAIMEKIRTFLQGFIIGLGKIMPGVSGSVMAICFGIYERMIAAFSSIKTMKKDWKFMAILGVGLGLAIVFGSNVIKLLLTSHYVPTMMFMIGMMIPGLFPIIKEVKNEDLTFRRTVICLAVLLFLIYLNVINTSGHIAGRESYFHEFISLFMCGIVDAASTIIPGISGSALLMLFGYYEAIIASLANVFSFQSALVLTPFLLGMALGVVLTSKLVTYLFAHHRVITYMVIIVFASFSVLAIFVNLLSIVESLPRLVFYSIFTVLGFATTYFLEKLFEH